MNIFLPADILIPKSEDMEKWAVIACDQFTSDPAYWQRVKANAGKSPSTIHLILPEVELGTEGEAKRVEEINQQMRDYLDRGIFETLKDSFIYVERTMVNGTVRKGLIGMIDLEAYDFNTHATSQIRATERTVLERIPPRVTIRRDAAIELPHVILLCDDDKKVLIEPITKQKESFKKLYDFQLMEGGKHIAGWLVSKEAAAQFNEQLALYSDTIGEKYVGISGVPMVFAVGDGNHSLATAKTCYEELKAKNPDKDLSNHPARYALVELENIHDAAQEFEPIHRIITHCNQLELLKALKNDLCVADEKTGFAVKWHGQGKSETIYLDKKKGQLAVGVLQNWLDEYLQKNEGEIDYIHDDEALIDLSLQENAIGFLLPTMEKSQLFRGVIADGALPRKTFSMGHSVEKRYYLEGRKIVE